MASLGSLAKRALPTVAASDNRFKLLAAGCTQLNVGSLVHSSDSHTRVRQRIPDANRNVRFGPLAALTDPTDKNR